VDEQPGHRRRCYSAGQEKFLSQNRRRNDAIRNRSRIDDDGSITLQRLLFESSAANAAIKRLPIQ
jgi:hypothetical protein